MCFYFHFGSQFPPAQNLHQIFLANQPMRCKCIEINRRQLELVDQPLQHVEINAYILHAVEVLKPEFRHPTLQWHLPTFKSNLAAMARPRLSPFVATCRGSATARTRTAPYTLFSFC